MKVVQSIFYFITLVYLGLPKYHKIIKLKVNLEVHFIVLLTDINKQTLFTSVSYKRITNNNNNNNNNNNKKKLTAKFSRNIE